MPRVFTKLPAVFSLLHAVLWKPLPVSQSGQLYQFMRTSPLSSGDSAFSYELYGQLQKAANPYGPLIATSTAGLHDFRAGHGEAERVTSCGVSANYFDVLGIRPFAGRVFEPADNSVLGGNTVVVLSYRFWLRRFHADASVIGSRVVYDDRAFTVAGIAQPGFTGVNSETAVDLWIPVTSSVPARWLQSPHINWMLIMARVGPNISPKKVESALATRVQRHVIEEVLPGMSQHAAAIVKSHRFWLRHAGSGLATTGRKYERPMLVLFGIVALVLLISCANLANLLLARNTAREHELAIRLALGASRLRIIGQLLTESALIALAGAALALPLANWGVKAIVAILPPSRIPRAYDFGVDGAVLAFTAALAIATALLFGVGPAVRAARGAAGNRTGTRTVTSRARPGKLLVCGQLAVSMILITGAVLFLRTLHNLATADLGFRWDNVISADLSFPRGAPAARSQAAFQQIAEQLSERGLIASWVWPGIYGHGGWTMTVHIRDEPPRGQDDEVRMVAVGPSFFEALGIGLERGRYFNRADSGSAPGVVIVNHTFATRLFGSRMPLGRGIVLARAAPREIVGVVRDVRHAGVRDPLEPVIYVPALQWPNSPGAALIVRGDSDPRSTADLIRRAVRSADSSAVVEQVVRLEDTVDGMISEERLLAILSTVFGGLAVLLAAIGLYGVMAYNMSRRRAEIGVRVALGATTGDIGRVVATECLKLVVCGLLAGTVATLALTRLVRSMMFGLSASDPLAIAGSVCFLVAVAAIAAAVPAWRASHLDPIAALRYE